MRIVSLVPSITEAVAALGGDHLLVGVTKYCTVGAPGTAERIGGTKNPSLQAIAQLAPDLVLANTEENRAGDLKSLRMAGLRVHESYPKTVPAARDLILELGSILDAAERAAAIAADIDTALDQAQRQAPAQRVVALTLIWRKPWMGVGADTYADDLLWRCGFANALSGFGQRYPRLEEGLLLGADVVLLPSEPYAFGDEDLPAVDRLAPGTPARLVDGELLTWHGPRTAQGLRTFAALAAELGQ
ncbi:MAG: ABC transporter substrate-binding protein [Nitriliruptorales bacterium]|nr:ABC transporter substrate-binding protein [Nitriliruptorales bacterium]